jgi:hypothetical protein
MFIMRITVLLYLLFFASMVQGKQVRQCVTCDTIFFEELHFLRETPLLYSLDPLGNFYFTDKRQTLHRFDLIEGTGINFSGAENFSFLDCRNSAQLFCFSQTDAKVLYLNRYLAEIEIFFIDNEQFTPLIAAPAADGNIWIFDARNFSVLKIDKIFREKIIEFFLQNLLSSGNFYPVFMREYHNLLWIVSEDGILLTCDNFGKVSTPKKIHAKNLFFEGDSFFYFDKKNKLLVHEKLSDTSKTLNKPHKTDFYDDFFYSDGRWYALKGKQVFVQKQM